MSPDNSDQLLSHLFRNESGKMASVLTRILGINNLDAAEDIVQDTLVKAVNSWKFKGIPDNPTAWLYAVAKRQAIDYLRQRSRRENIEKNIANEFQSEWTLSPMVNQFFLPTEIEDSQLRMVFLCCHPAIPYESQIAFALKTLCGLSVSEIAKAFLTNDETIAKRIYRAREKIKEERIVLDVPVGPELRERLEAVWHTLYLLFNEGYNSSNPDFFIRRDLCMEALRLALLLTKNPSTNLPESNALVALMCFHASRESTRLAMNGDVVLLQDQDRTQWDNELIQKGVEYLDQATTDNNFNLYSLQAAIAGMHARAREFSETDWASIRKLYLMLCEINPSPIIRLNMAIATGYAVSAAEGLKELLSIDGLEQTLLFHASKGDLLSMNNNFQLAQESYEMALTLAESKYQKDLLIRKLKNLTPASDRSRV